MLSNSFPLREELWCMYSSLHRHRCAALQWRGATGERGDGGEGGVGSGGVSGDEAQSELWWVWEVLSVVGVAIVVVRRQLWGWRQSGMDRMPLLCCYQVAPRCE
jgi:hypothetical protein